MEKVIDNNNVTKSVTTIMIILKKRYIIVKNIEKIR